MAIPDHYAALGVKRDASQEEIKRAYRKLARKYHPDIASGADAEARFKELGEAYEVLKDPEKRAQYDQLRKYGTSAGEFRPSAFIRAINSSALPSMRLMVIPVISSKSE